jgi:hypothetical protein
MMSINLAVRAKEGRLTVEEVNATTKDKLEVKDYIGITVLVWASQNCPIEVIEAILDKGVNIDGLSIVNIVIIEKEIVVIIKLTHFIILIWNIWMKK